ncbi:hypothetical protein M569_16900, partial [Genlisea aurea]
CFSSFMSRQFSDWIVDSGASEHMCYQKNLFTELYHIPEILVKLPTGATVNITEIGTVPVTDALSLRNVLYVPSFQYNLISVIRL